MRFICTIKLLYLRMHYYCFVELYIILWSQWVSNLYLGKLLFLQEILWIIRNVMLEKATYSLAYVVFSTTPFSGKWKNLNFIYSNASRAYIASVWLLSCQVRYCHSFPKIDVKGFLCLYIDIGLFWFRVCRMMLYKWQSNTLSYLISGS